MFQDRHASRSPPSFLDLEIYRTEVKYKNRNRTSISWPRLREMANYGKNRVELAVRLHDFQVK
ncbi:hypothetical protein CWR43_07700 [Rhizobium sullae]|uniref:Uncharacterized protein n=1 Tax=Rhizobium sullae TaxID=50338 RepID=A0A2N0DDJ2_RHISU|nr:hypothetical protein CWR43_07700 [Rhizobium sullae]